MQRRQLLKLAPLAALAALPIKVEGTQPQTFEVKTDKKYIFIFDKSAEQGDFIRAFSDDMKREGVQGIILTGDHHNFAAYELEAK